VKNLALMTYISVGCASNPVLDFLQVRLGMLLCPKLPDVLSARRLAHAHLQRWWFPTPCLLALPSPCSVLPRPALMILLIHPLPATSLSSSAHRI
jgi:hypothetical protein